MQEKKKPQEFKQASISEFFEKNRHILGFDSLQRALFIMVKEAVDNSLDACEEHGILPYNRLFCLYICHIIFDIYTHFEVVCNIVNWPLCSDMREVENGDKKKSITSVINYTDDTVSFDLKIVFPFREVDIKIENLGSAETYSYEEGLDQVKGNYTGAEYFVTGINPVLVQGAEELPADWDLKGVEVNEQE